MQLFFNTETDIGIQKMSAIQQETLEEKFINKNLIDKIDSDIDDIPNGNDNCANIKDIVEISNENVKTKVDEQVTNEIQDISESFFSTNHKESREEEDKTHIKDESSKKVENIQAVTNEHIKLEENNKTSDLEYVKNNDDVKNSKMEIKNIEEKKENCEVECRQTEGLMGKSKEEDTEKREECGNQNKSEEIKLDNEDIKGNSEQNTTKDIDKNEVKEKVICGKMNEPKVEVIKADKLEIQVNNVDEIDKNKDISQEGNKEIVKTSQIESTVDMGISDGAEKNVCIESSSLSTSNYNDKQLININCDTLVTGEEINSTLSGKSNDINENNKIISEKYFEKTDEFEKHEEMGTNMESDDVTNTVMDKNDHEKDIDRNKPLQSSNCDVNNQTINDKTKVMTDINDREEVIDIADEKDEDYKDETKEISVTVNKQDISNTKRDDPSIQIPENNTNSANFEVNVSSSEKKEKLNSGIFDKDIKTITEKQFGSDNNVEEKKKFSHVSKLSNTLDILSDDEDPSKNEFHKDIQNTVNVDKQFINLEDDDDIMLIDEETNTSSIENKTENVIDSINDIQENEDCKEEYKIEELDLKESSSMSQDFKDNSEPEVGVDTNDLNQEANMPEESEPQLKPLLPVNFLKSCKKNLADMTRDELEEFCILKIVESVVDRGNLSEIKSQLKTMAQNIDEYKKKASMLTKQNRELQVVLKSVQEEQKKKSDSFITPLKITRSVGIQVLMTDKIGVRRKPLQGMNTLQNNLVTNSASPRSGKTQVNQNSRLKTNSNTSPTIPVPRLVPAVNNSNLNNIKVQTTNTNSPAKSQVANIPNGLSSLPTTQKPEKRPHSRIQQNNSVTVDLTDDEPPSKLLQRTATPPVRLVNPQNLMAPHRQPFGTNINSPRKVYIPISGSQNQSVRPGQTIMLKALSPQGPRQRCATPAVSKPNQTPSTVRMQRLPSRHPAPLPDSMKQYQPPNWKALPPAPELKLSKVENGIVISWKIDGYQEENHEEIASYQLYAYQETASPPNTALWKKIGDVKALPLPMACTLTQFMAGYKYYFAVRAVDVRSRLGPFSLPGSILLLNKM